MALLIVALIGSVGATSEIIENLRNGRPSDWQEAWAKELSSGISVLILVPLLMLFLNWLNLSFSNLRWRIGWHLPGFLLFSLLHIGLFTLIRTFLWASAGETYEPGGLGWNLLYEMRKDLLVYVGIVTLLGGYEFILNRLRGEARFLTMERPTGMSSASISTSAASADKPDGQRQQFLVKMLNREFLVKVDEIDWIGSASNYVLMNCGSKSYPMRQTLSSLAEQLDPDRFMRVHRTAIVNLRQVQNLREQGDLALELDSGQTVPVSKTYLPELKQALVSTLQ